MITPTNASAGAALTSTHAATAPDWDKVPFEVGCARCGYDLHGLTEPKCPGCSLEFDWAEAVPIEELTCIQCAYHLYGLSKNRCPECARTFNWNDAVARYHRTRLPYFEYRWRDSPMRSFFRTWRLALWPRRFWKHINLHDPPNVGALMIMVLLGIGMTLVAVVAHHPISVLAGAAEYALSAGGWLRFSDFAYYSAALIGSVGEGVADASTWSVTGFVALWAMAGLGALLIFRQSMRQCQVRTVQVIRVWAYASSMALPIATLFAGIVVKLPWIMPIVSQGTIGLIIAATLFLSWAHVVWSLGWGYRAYLRMPHAFAVALCAQIIAVLFTATVAVFPTYISYFWQG